jgi:hypothetical protein
MCYKNYLKVLKSEISYLNLNHMRTLSHGFVAVQTWFINHIFLERENIIYTSASWNIQVPHLIIQMCLRVYICGRCDAYKTPQTLPLALSSYGQSKIFRPAVGLFRVATFDCTE